MPKPRLVPSVDISLDALAKRAEDAVGIHTRAYERLLVATSSLTLAQAKRPTAKIEALARLCGQTHPTTGKTFSASQAEDVLQLDPEYAAYKSEVAVFELNKKRAELEVENARLLAEAEIAIVRAAVGAGR